uniref:Uncharacterized protein n=1 Tax=Physcomitrium patens TaxID=3218 RepID=A0A7I4ARY9_PHYPA
MLEELKEIEDFLPDVTKTPVGKYVDSSQSYSTEMASSNSANSSLRRSLSRNLTPSSESSRKSSRKSFDKSSSRSSGSEDDHAPFQMTLSEINQQTDVEKEISQFVKELVVDEGIGEFISTTEMPKYDADGDNQYSKNSLLASESSRYWDAKIHSPSLASNYEQDDVSSLKMTYYAFKETTGQKSGIPVSLLAAHLETKEPHYPSFFGSRSSVSVTENPSARSFRTLQRSPSRRTSIELIHPAFSPQVMEVINALEAHKKKAEFDGNYVEARAATQRLNGVKLWDEKLQEFLKAVVEHAAKLKRQQISVLQAFRQRMAAKMPTKPQWSREVLKHKKVQVIHVMWNISRPFLGNKGIIWRQIKLNILWIGWSTQSYKQHGLHMQLR